jgi:hypothetical protein
MDRTLTLRSLTGSHMVKDWDRYGRKGLDIAHSASTLGFSVAKVSTRLGVSSIPLDLY